MTEAREGAMLSERERRTLREIEQQLAEEDERFAEVMSRPLTGRRWIRHGYDATIVLAGLLTVICLALASNGAAGAGVVAAALAVGAFYLRRRRFPPAATPR
jgi:DUF3040 family protein